MLQLRENEKKKTSEIKMIAEPKANISEITDSRKRTK